jgi:DnaJ-class molecular chaperone
VLVRGKLGESHAADDRKADVRWCIRRSDGTFRAGLEFRETRSAFEFGRDQIHSIRPDRLDCYEVMQLSPNADRAIISHAYRRLAARYHPDNTETGNSELFIRLSMAYEILKDPEKRARYDATRNLRPESSEKVAAPPTPSGGKARKQPDVRNDVKSGSFRPSVGTLRGWNTARGGS